MLLSGENDTKLMKSPRSPIPVIMSRMYTPMQNKALGKWAKGTRMKRVVRSYRLVPDVCYL